MTVTEQKPPATPRTRTPRTKSARTGRFVSKLTPALTEKLCEQLRRGHYIQPACAAVGIHPDSYRAWRQQALDAIALRQEGHVITAVQVAFVDFYEATEDARAYGEWWLVEQILVAAGEPGRRDKWQAYMTILERSRRERWRRPSSVELVDARLAAQAQMQAGADSAITIRLAFGDPDADGDD